MSDIWVIFIDVSGSMSGPFSSTAQDYSGLMEKGSYHTKIDAAKDILIKQIQGLRGGEVAIIGFNQSSFLIHRGFSRNIEHFKERIQNLQAGGGTNVGGALLFGTELENIKNYQVVSFLMITDGLANGNLEQAAQDCITTLPSLRISTILIDYTDEGHHTAETISMRGDIKVVASSIALENAVNQARESHKDVVATAGGVYPPDFRSLRGWWHNIARNYDHYKCYAIFLCLPSDNEAIRYITDFGRELDLISGKDCLILAFSKTEFKRVSFDDRLWEHAINEQVTEGYSLETAKHFKIKLTDFPCVLLFEDIRAKQYEIFSFKEKNAEEISMQMRLIFAQIQESVEKNEKPITMLKRHKMLSNLKRVHQSIGNKIFAFGGKTFDSAMEAWLKTVIK